jgi:hypothetical protein
MAEPIMALTETPTQHAASDETSQTAAPPAAEPAAAEEARDVTAGERAAPAHPLDVAQRATQRATQSFVFRSGGLRGRVVAHTIAEAVAYIDHHPDDGIFHLRTGTLAQWLEAEGASDLAQLARTALYEGRADRRAGLEWFLVGTGLAARPQLVLRPRRLDLGYVVAGQRETATLHVSKGRGRGYLFGAIRANEAWVNPLPRTFANGAADILVSVETETLPIRQAAHEARLLIESNATPEPARVPVCVRVVASPARIHRWGLRPLVALAMAALLGAALGGLLAAAGMPGVGWAVIAAWSLCGLARGLWQPPAWPVRYAAVHWLKYVGGWAMGLLAAGLLAALYGVAVTGTGQPLPLGRLALWMLALAVVPATIHAIRRTRRASMVRYALDAHTDDRPRRRAILLVAAAAALIALLAAPFVARPTWETYRQNGVTASVQERSDTAWAGLNKRVNQWFDRVYLYYYDRRAPSGGAAVR